MKLVAQRVVQPGGHVQATHAFYYLHGGYAWLGAPPLDLGHGTLQATHFVLPPGGNHVLTYLDIVAPDETPTATIFKAFLRFHDATRPPPPSQTFGNCTFSWSMTHTFQLAWRQELMHLYNAAIAMRATG